MDGDSLTAEFITETDWDSLPEPVRRKARMCLMDSLAAVISGSRTAVSRISADYAEECLAGKEATILVHGRKSTAAGAAFANGSAANGLDTDDGIRYAYGHAGAQLFPTVLALCEAGNRGGKRLLSGMVVGYEVAHRIGRCWHDDHQVYQACGSWGSVASAAAASHIMGLGGEETRNALGIADYYAPNLPMMRDIENPTMVKHGIGWGAFTGISAAQLAGRGFTGIPSLLSEKKYFDWVRDIGQNFIMVDGVGWKSAGYACCGWAHGAAKGSKILKDRHRFDPSRIKKITVETFAESAALGKELPATMEEAQFNLAWPIAAVLVDGEIGPSQTLENRLNDEAIRTLASKVEIIENEDLNELCRLFKQGDPRGRFASSVKITLEDGSVFESGLVDGGLSYPPEGWDDQRMEEKFHWLVDPVLGADRAAGLIDTVRAFENHPSVDELIRLTAALPRG